MDALRNAVFASKAPDMPTKGISGQLGRTTISQNTPATTSTDQNPFVATTGGKGNLLWNPQLSTRGSAHQQNPVSSHDDEVAIIRDTISHFSMASTNEAWMDQVRQWHVKYGDAGRVTKYSGFPLCPGGAQPGLSECYKCGKTGHTRAACSAIPGGCIPEKEAIFWSTCGSILRGTRQPSAAVNHVGTVESDNDWLWKANTIQGNGEGPPA
jgi:hypothetical protein